MIENHGKYSRQPAFNEFVLPNCPPSYSEAVSASKPGKSLYSTMEPVQPVQCVPPPSSGVIMAPCLVGPSSSLITCPTCHVKNNTITKCISQKSAHVACFLLFLFGCCLCSCIPYCLKSFKNVYHYCSNCNSFVGCYEP